MATTGTGTVDLRNGSQLTINLLSGTDSFKGTLVETGTSPGAGGSLIKNGAGTLTLNGTSSYTGPTTINGGEFLLAAVSDLPVNTRIGYCRRRPASFSPFGNQLTTPLQLAKPGPLGILNLNNNDAIIHNSNLALLTFGGKQVATTVRGMVLPGILSSAAASTPSALLGIESASSYAGQLRRRDGCQQRRAPSATWLGVRISMAIYRRRPAFDISDRDTWATGILITMAW